MENLSTQPQAEAPTGPEHPSVANPGYVVSTLNYPVELTYDGVSFMVPPHGKATGLKREKLGNLPPGIAFIAQ